MSSRSLLSRSRPILLPLVAVALVAAVTAPVRGALAPAHRATAPTEGAVPYVLRDGATAPVYSYPNAIRESVWVRTADRDGNGRPDRVGVDIIRPAELDGEARVPVIMDASPYYACCGRGNESELKRYDDAGRPVRFPLYYDNYFVPRGYAVVQVDLVGTNRSSGCVDHGGASDIGSATAVIDWLNGRARAVDADGDRVEATWADGRVGMIGKSYDGTIANGAAATGVEGLETIVPISAISSWYDYDRFGNLPTYPGYPSYLSRVVSQNRTEPVPCGPRYRTLDRNADDATGQYNRFWSRRDYRAAPVPDASRVEASVFAVHGLQDANVKTQNVSRWWRALDAAGVQRRLWLTRLGHVDPFDSDRRVWVRELHAWFDHELMGVDNGADRGPRVRVEVAPGTRVTGNRWPLRPGSWTALRPRPGEGLATGAPSTGAVTFVNEPGQSEEGAVTRGDNPARVLFATDPLRRDYRLSGTAQVRLRVRSHVPTGQVGVALVDYGAADRVLADGDGATTLDEESCHGSSTERDDACYHQVARLVAPTLLQVLARGWSRLDGAGSHRVRLPLSPNDVVVPAGHRLGLVVFGASPQYVMTVDETRSTYRVGLGGTALWLPGPVAFRPGTARPFQPPAAHRVRPGTVPSGPQYDLLPY